MTKLNNQLSIQHQIAHNKKSLASYNKNFIIMHLCMEFLQHVFSTGEIPSVFKKWEE